MARARNSAQTAKLQRSTTPEVLALRDALKKTGKFDEMNLEIDEAEHSLEMHLPYVRKVFEGCATIFSRSCILEITAEYYVGRI